MYMMGKLGLVNWIKYVQYSLLYSIIQEFCECVCGSVCFFLFVALRVYLWIELYASNGILHVACNLLERMLPFEWFFEKRFDDLGQTGVCSDKQTRNAHQHNYGVDKHHACLLEATCCFIVDEKFDYGRKG